MDTTKALPHIIAEAAIFLDVPTALHVLCDQARSLGHPLKAIVLTKSQHEILLRHLRDAQHPIPMPLAPLRVKTFEGIPVIVEDDILDVRTSLPQTLSTGKI